MTRRDPFEGVGIAGLDRRPGAPPDRVAEESVAEEEKRSRRWDEANRAFSFRIREQDAQRLASRAQDIPASRDALARALIEAALDAVDKGWIDLVAEEKKHQTTDRLGRVRVCSRRFVQVVWKFDRISDSGA
jgi:hypothetical protein